MSDRRVRTAPAYNAPSGVRSLVVNDVAMAPSAWRAKRFELPSRYRHLERPQVRYARWDLARSI